MDITLSKKILVITWVYLLIFPFFSYAAEDEYLAFLSKAYLKSNGELSVNEEFIFDYGENPRHGLYRSIPLILENSDNWSKIQSISVKNKDGEPYIYETNSLGNIAKIKIGQQNITLTGSHYYNISYSLTNIGEEEKADWLIVNRMREPIIKFESYFYLPAPVLENSATATCQFIPSRFNDGCSLIPLVKSGFVAGYKIDTENVLKEDILISVKYPKGIISVSSIEDNNKINISKSNLLFGILFLIITSMISILYIFRNKIKGYIVKNKKPIVSPDTYSYLARSISYKNKIEVEYVVATIVDLAERGYVSLSQFAHPVGINESIDYSVDLISDELPNDSEKTLVLAMGNRISSLSDWLYIEYPKSEGEIERVARKEVEDVFLSIDLEELPSLVSFKIIKKQHYN